MQNRNYLVIIDSYIDINKYKNIPKLELWLGENVKFIDFEALSSWENISLIKIPKKTIIDDSIKKCNLINEILIDNDNKSIQNIDVSNMNNVKYY
jgi:hypothetical protein